MDKQGASGYSQDTKTKEAYRKGRQGQVTWEEYANTVQAWRDALKKTKTHLHFNLGREMEDKEAFLNTSPATGRLGKCEPAA